MHICFYIIKTDYDIILIYFLLNTTRLLKFKNDWKKINLDPEPKNKLIPKIFNQVFVFVWLLVVVLKGHLSFLDFKKRQSF